MQEGGQAPFLHAPVLDLLRPERRPDRPELRDGYLDLLGDEDPTGAGPGQRLMVSRALPSGDITR